MNFATWQLAPRYRRIAKLILFGSFVVAWGIPFGSSLPLNAAEENAELATTVKKEVRRLADRDLAERDAAEKKLIELGPTVIDLLPPIVDRMPEEVKVRLNRVRGQLEKAYTEAAILPTQLTLAGDEITVDQLIAEVAKQTGNELFDNRDDFGQALDPVKFKLSWKGIAFWPAIDAALDQADLSLYPYREDQKLGLVVRSPGQHPRANRATYQGPFRIEPQKIELQRDLRLADGGGMTVTLEVAWEPRLSPIAITMPLDNFTLTDDKGKPIEGVGPGISPEISVASGSKATELSIPWSLPPRSAESIASLKGKLMVLVPGRTEEFRFENLAAANMDVQRRGGVVVTLDAVRQNNDLWEAFVRVRFDKADGALESYRGWYYQNECYLVDAKGTRIDYSAFDRTKETEDEFGLGYLFDSPEGLKGLTLVYRTPTVIMNVPVEFELNDLPLP
jgi:hypothetical protein